MGGSVLQSWEWGEFRRSHGWEPLRLLGEGGVAAAQVLMRRLPGVGPLAYVPHGPLVADAADPAEIAEALVESARSCGAYALEVEPRVPEEQGLALEGFTRSASSVQPRCTLVVEVLEDEEKQLAAFPKDTRYGVRRARREGIEAGPSSDVERDLEDFLALLEETAERQKFALRPREYYRRFMRELPAHLIAARRSGEEKLLAGAVILTFGSEAYYLYGASAREGDNLYASYLVQHAALSVARDEGAKRYDMWGIPCEPHEDHLLWGVYQFKKKFGGHQERYVGAHEKVLSPLRARLAQAAIRGYYSLQKIRGRSSGPISD